MSENSPRPRRARRLSLPLRRPVAATLAVLSVVLTGILSRTVAPPAVDRGPSASVEQALKLPSARPPATPSMGPKRARTRVPVVSRPPAVLGNRSVLKPMLRGLMTRRGLPPADALPMVNAFVLDLRWADLQATKGGALSTRSIEEMLGRVRRLNDGRPGLGLAMKLRIRAGIDAPAWAKRIGGEPVTINDPTSGTTGTVGRFWLPEFGRAYASLQSALAARYDKVPEIREIVVSRCTTIYSEPFIRQAADKASREGLVAAGYTPARDRSCQREQIEAHAAWRTTRSGIAFSPYQLIESPSAAWTWDDALPDEMMRYCRTALGERCVLENNSLRSPPLEKWVPMYERMRKLGPLILFQTARPEKVGDLLETLRYAVRLGANAVELPRSWETMAAEGDLKAMDTALEANPT